MNKIMMIIIKATTTTNAYLGSNVYILNLGVRSFILPDTFRDFLSSFHANYENVASNTLQIHPSLYRSLLFRFFPHPTV
jgi:hypothetical protein